MNLQNRFFYRLVKVMHYFMLFTCIGIIAVILFENIPHKIIDNNKSAIICKNGKSYHLNEANLFIAPPDQDFDNKNDNQAKIFCKYGPPITDTELIAKLEKAPASKKDSLSDWEVVTVPVERNYSTNFQFQRDWKSFKRTIITSLIIFSIIYIVLNIIKETLIYLAFGRKFTWKWLFISMF